MPTYEYDLFISHAFEDKKPFVDNLARDLAQRGVKVWYSGFELKGGDSIFDSIQDGLRQSAMGLVVISPTYVKKEYARREMKAMFNREIIQGSKHIIPVWYQIDYQTVSQQEPLLVDKYGINANLGIEQVSQKILEAVNAARSATNAPTLSGSKVEAVPAVADNPAYTDLKFEIGKNRIQSVIQKLIALTQNDPYHHNDAILLSGRYASLQQREMKGLLSADDGIRQENVIKHSILQFISNLENQ